MRLMPTDEERVQDISMVLLSPCSRRTAGTKSLLYLIRVLFLSNLECHKKYPRTAIVMYAYYWLKEYSQIYLSPLRQCVLPYFVHRY